MEPTSDVPHILIADTTLRDGEQAPGCHLAPGQKLQIARQLARLGVDIIEAGFPASSPAELEAVQMIAATVGREADAPEICAFARCVPGDIDRAWEAVRQARRPRLHLFLATSDIHLEHKLKMSRSEALERAAKAVAAAARYPAHIQFAPEDASRSDPTFLAQVVEAVIAAGAGTVNIPDTVGYALPDEFARLIAFLRENVPNAGRAVFAVHCHDDLGLAAANSLAAIQAGAQQIECTVNGLGERAGNCALEEVVMALRTRADLFPFKTRVQTREIAATSRLVSELTGMPVQPNKAVVGSNAFAHASGIHQDGLLKHRLTYEIMRPEDVGVESSRLVLTSRSGRTALRHRLQGMGYAVTSDHLEQVFLRFKQLADRQRYVQDTELPALLQDPPST